jgi:hypothetical protein
MKNWKPIFIENSKIPVWLSYIAPINIWAISIGWFVWCKGTMSEVTKRHETIHFQQQLELAFAGQWILYGLSWLYGLWKYKDSAVAYRENVFEREAYSNDYIEDYLETRPRYAWVRHWGDNKDDYKERIKRTRRDRIAASSESARVQRRES